MKTKFIPIIAFTVIISIFAVTAAAPMPVYAEQEVQKESVNDSSNILSTLVKGAAAVFAFKMIYDSFSGEEADEYFDETLITNQLDSRTIVIDPGHGGSLDFGGVGISGLTEKEVTLDISLRLYELLNNHSGATVYMTRRMDHPLSNSKRTEIALNHNADILISVHSNAFKNENAHGIETYTHPNAPGTTVNLARNIQNSLVNELGLRDRGLKQNDFEILSENQSMKSLRTEIGFITNPAEEELLSDPDFRQKAAVALYKGIVNYYQ